MSTDEEAIMIRNNEEYCEMTSLTPLYRLFGMDFVEKARSIAVGIINKIDNIRYANKLEFLHDIHYDAVSFRAATAGIYGASLYHAQKIMGKHFQLTGKDILIIGCGKGEEIHQLIKHNPASIYAIDYLDYSADWKKIIYPNVTIKKADFKTEKFSRKFDVVFSKAVLEHVSGLQESFPILVSFLKEGGFFWADFGPLYYTWGGPHARTGYKHLTLSEDEYHKVLLKTKNEKAILFWERNLYSRLRFSQYLECFRPYLATRYLAIEISEDGCEFRRKHYWEFKNLAQIWGEENLLLKAVCYLGQKK